MRDRTRKELRGSTYLVRVDGLPQVLHALHLVDCSVSEPLCKLAVLEDGGKGKDRLVFAYEK
jgi:hypothetical protein